MPRIQIQREHVLTEAVVSAYIHELAAPERLRPAGSGEARRVALRTRGRSRRDVQSRRAVTARQDLAAA